MTFIQLQILAHIRACLRRDGRSPTLANIGAWFHLSPTTICRHVAALVAWGKLVKMDGRANGLSIPPPGYFVPTPDGRPWVSEVPNG